MVHWSSLVLSTLCTDCYGIDKVWQLNQRYTLTIWDEYKCKLIEKTEHLCKRMRWKPFFFLHPSVDGNRKETFGFSSPKSPPQVHAMLNFEKRLLGMVKNIKFRKVKCEFQKKLSAFDVVEFYPFNPAADSVTIARKLQSRPTRKPWTSLMSLSTCPPGSTWLTPNRETSHSTSTGNQTIHLALLKTFQNPSTNGCPKFNWWMFI